MKKLINNKQSKMKIEKLNERLTILLESKKRKEKQIKELKKEIRDYSYEYDIVKCNMVEIEYLELDIEKLNDKINIINEKIIKYEF